MTPKAKAMMNMAMSIATINGTDIERMDLQKTHMGHGFSYYALTVWYSDSKEVTIREDCTIVER